MTSGHAYIRALPIALLSLLLAIGCSDNQGTAPDDSDVLVVASVMPQPAPSVQASPEQKFGPSGLASPFPSLTPSELRAAIPIPTGYILDSILEIALDAAEPKELVVISHTFLRDYPGPPGPN